MAEAVVSFAVERLGELLISEAKQLYGVSKQINEVQRELERMQCFLEEADRRQNRDQRIRKWVAEMRGLAFKIEDVIEYFAMEVATNKEKFDFMQTLQRFVCILSEGVSRHKIAKKIHTIKSDITNLTSSLLTYGITKGLEGENSSSLVDLKSRRTYSHDIEKDFVGMENETRQLISHLKKEDMGCEVVSICGMGGQGKTSLAKKIYNHTQVKAHFKAFAWICITHQFDREKVLKGVLKQLLPANREGEVSTMEDAKLVKELYKIQQEKNCLIVVDDIWTIDSWRSLKPAFPIGETTSGSKILLTTRDANVAAIGSIYKIEGLTEEEGWQLLSTKAGINDRTDNMVAFEMERIGRNMVKRCKGLPLAISSLGGILKGKLFREWEIINKDVSFYLAKFEGVSDDDEYYTVRQVLGLSYDSLPPRLRHCFLCFANYEEDEKIKTEELYMFWIAEGLISLEDKAQGEMMLDVAERYLDELARRSLVQVETSKVEGVSPSKYLTCSVHDLIRDLCLFKVKEEKVIKVIHSQRKPDEEAFKASIVRRLCIRSYYHGNGNESMFKHYDRHLIQNIRCLSVWSNASYSSIQTTKFWPNEILSLKKFKLLRVFTASGYIFTKENIRSISELVYLKYLCLRDCRLKELPSSIGNLRNLETLDARVSNCIRIPNVVWKLKQLKHLYLPKYLIGGRPEKLRLEGLNELQLISNYDSVYCDTRDLIQLFKLKVFGGKIIVDLTEDMIGYIKSRELRHSDVHIEGKGGQVCLVLLLECGFIDVLRISSRVSVFPDHDHTRFSGCLTELYLFGCRMEQDPMILLEKLCNLHDLFFDDNAYVGEKMICTAMGFPKLKYLFMRKLPNLTSWRVVQGAMPNLSNIEIYKCEALEMLPHGFRYLTALQFLRVSYMPSTFTNRIEVINGVQGEDLYKVHHIPDVIISRYL
ncbi:putative disease resistance protein At1g50180 [Apium graveolens]|uniref:putative disease resistance protein At1g50180 n=1 Tax=Apium graveolens TaxID=4045 RepID=UPI003D7B93ED